MPELNLSSPWFIWASELNELFLYDSEVTCSYDNDVPSVTLRVDNPTKADAIAKILPTEKEFGNVILAVNVLPCNDESTTEQLFRTAFDDNPAFAGILVGSMPDGSEVTYAAFAPEVAQFRNDDISSAYGVATMTYEQIARDVIGEDDGVFVCSALLDDD